MKQLLNRTIPILFVGLFMSQGCFSKNLDKNELAMRCETIAYRLGELAFGRFRDACASAVALAGAYTQSAADSLRLGDTKQGFSSLNFAEKRLKEVQSLGMYCEYSSPQVGPYIDEIIQLERELASANDVLNK
ncbi:TPA: hypothetical protein ACTUNV_002628 [Legionella pneumophila]